MTAETDTLERTPPQAVDVEQKRRQNEIQNTLG